MTECFAGPTPPPSRILYGFVSSNRTLTFGPPGPVYDVIGDLVVQPGVTLTVQPGVTLRMAASDTLQGGDYPSKVEIDVFGTMIADASTGDSIRIVTAGLSSSEWGQIKVQSGGSVVLRRALVRGATAGLFVAGGSATVSSATIGFGNTGVAGTGSISLTSVVIADCLYGISIPGATGTVRQCVLRGNGPGSGGIGLEVGAGVSTAPFDSTDAVPTEISNFATGVKVGPGGSASNLIVRDNQSGIVWAGGGFRTIRYCTVVRSLGHGITLTFDPGETVVNCIVAQNAGYGILNGYIAYSDVWSNSQGSWNGTAGPSVASFNPFFVDAGANDFHLAQGSIFKNFSNSGGEIGAYGPGPGPPVPARRVSWGAVKARYR